MVVRPKILDKTEGKIRSEGNKGGDTQRVGEAAAAGASVGAIAGSVAGHPGMGAGIGAGAGAAAALMGVLLSRGPEAVLAKGTTVEMVIDRALIFDENEIENWMARGRAIGEGPGASTEPQTAVRAHARDAGCLSNPRPKPSLGATGPSK